MTYFACIHGTVTARPVVGHKQLGVSADEAELLVLMVGLRMVVNFILQAVDQQEHTIGA